MVKPCRVFFFYLNRRTIEVVELRLRGSATIRYSLILVPGTIQQSMFISRRRIWYILDDAAMCSLSQAICCKIYKIWQNSAKFQAYSGSQYKQWNSFRSLSILNYFNKNCQNYSTHFIMISNTKVTFFLFFLTFKFSKCIMIL